MSKMLSLIFAAVCGFSLLTGCEKPPETGTGAASNPAGGTSAAGMTFVMVPKGVHPYYEPCRQGFEDACKKYGITPEFRAPKEFELPQQVAELENLVSRANTVKGITISAVDDKGLVNVIKQATDAGIKVITFDAAAPSTAALCYIGTLNDAAGYAAGVEFAKAMNNSGEVVVLQGGLGTPNLNERYAGFERALKEKAPDMKIVGREDTQGKWELATSKTENLLQAHPNVKGIFGISAECIPGAANVLKSQNKAGQIVLAGFDDLPDTLAAIRSGTCTFALAQKTYKMGWESVEVLRDAIAGKEVKKQIDTGVQVITKANVDTYMEDMKKEVAQLSGGPAAASAPAK
jgi:ribose transport system substrate-binding protein